MKICFIGDIVGRPGRRALDVALPALIAKYECDFVIANGENAASGYGISAKVADEIYAAGVDVITSGNHIWAAKDTPRLLEEDDRILRPANFPPGQPGRGSRVYETRDGRRIGVINLIGRIFMDPADCPFRRGDEELEKLGKTDAVLIDFHAEATSEKQALGYYFDGRVAAVVGTHTHVTTSDEHILPRGTAYITDCGMTGPVNTVLGVEKEIAVRRFLTGMPERFAVPKQGEAVLSGVVIEVALDKHAAVDIQRVSLRVSDRNPDLVEI
jgi:2',3'-cyclic-nucleotide 2'-phosphodiesterase